ncbi:MAG: hypothetical protein ACLP2H_15210 [Terriglobales bacterium]
MASFSQVQNAGATTPAFREFTIVRSELSDSTAPISAGGKAIEAQRADGSRVSGEVILKGDEVVPPALRDITLMPERMKMRVDDALKAKTTMYMQGPAPTHPPAADPQCGISHLAPQVKPTVIGQETILGFATVGIQTEMQGPDESSVMKEWRAPDLDCAVLRMSEIRRNPAGETIGKFRYEALKVTLGPPASELFAIPADYAEKSPSQMYQAYLDTVGDAQRPIPEGFRKTLEREDQRYFASRNQPH